MNLRNEDLTEATLLWFGRGTSPWPSQDDARVIKRFGVEMSSKLLPRLHQLQDDFYDSDARIVATDLNQMGELAQQRFRTRYPDIPEEVVQTLSWAYTYDYK